MKTYTFLRNVVFSGILLLAFLPSAQAGKLYYQTHGVAIQGYDVVAYFTQKKAVKGKKQFAKKWKGATWYFSSAKNKTLFTKQPKRYTPQFGGYCAWAVSRGYTAATDPQAWDIVKGKLYLNYNTWIQRRWKRARKSNIVKGHKNWPRLLKGLKK